MPCTVNIKDGAYTRLKQHPECGMMDPLSCKLAVYLTLTLFNCGCFILKHNSQRAHCGTQTRSAIAMQRVNEVDISHESLRLC